MRQNKKTNRLERDPCHKRAHHVYETLTRNVLSMQHSRMVIYRASSLYMFNFGNQKRFFFFVCACFFAACSFLRFSSALLRSAFSSGVSSCTSSTGVGSLTFLSGGGGGEDGGSAVGDRIRVICEEGGRERCESSPSIPTLPLPPILNVLRDFLGVAFVCESIIWEDGGSMDP